MKHQIWKPIKNLDAEIRTMEKREDSRGDEYYAVEVGLFESLGESGDILTLDYDTIESEQEVIDDVKEHLSNLKIELSERVTSGREDKQLEILNRLV